LQVRPLVLDVDSSIHDFRWFHILQYRSHYHDSRILTAEESFLSLKHRSIYYSEHLDK